MEEIIYINGECGEQIVVSPTRVKPDGGKEHEGVILELEGVTQDNNGDLCIILSPYMAKVLAKEIEASAEEAYEVNYHLLVEKNQL